MMFPEPAISFCVAITRLHDVHTTSLLSMNALDGHLTNAHKPCIPCPYLQRRCHFPNWVSRPRPENRPRKRLVAAGERAARKASLKRKQKYDPSSPGRRSAISSVSFVQTRSRRTTSLPPRGSGLTLQYPLQAPPGSKPPTPRNLPWHRKYPWGPPCAFHSLGKLLVYLEPTWVRRPQDLCLLQILPIRRATPRR
jgi:hypothetical protein